MGAKLSPGASPIYYSGVFLLSLYFPSSSLLSFVMDAAHSSSWPWLSNYAPSLLIIACVPAGTAAAATTKHGSHFPSPTPVVRVCLTERERARGGERETLALSFWLSFQLEVLLSLWSFDPEATLLLLFIHRRRRRSQLGYTFCTEPSNQTKISDVQCSTFMG